MPPKKELRGFQVDGVQCTVKDGLVNVGLNAGWPRHLRFPMKVKSTDGLVEKVRAHVKFAALVSHGTSALIHDRHLAHSSLRPWQTRPTDHTLAHCTLEPSYRVCRRLEQRRATGEHERA